jgi:hypothetical protein
MSAIRAATWAALLPLLPLHAAAESSCGSALSGPTRTIDGTRYIVVFQTLPQPVEVGTHFAVDFAVCPRASAEAPSAVRVDANMPAHRHGMNYRAKVSPKGDGRYVAEGLLFHMPGQWRLLFDVDRGGKTERLAANITLE